jgi:hypothetical protein
MQPTSNTPGGPPSQLANPGGATPKKESCYPTGMRTYSDNYRGNFYESTAKDTVWHPCFGNVMANAWEDERDACYEGDCFTCLKNGCASRVCHVFSCLFDTGFCLTSPIVCTVGSVSALSCFCLSNCASLVSLAHCNSAARERLRIQSDKLIRASAGVCVATTRITGGLVAIEICDIMKFPLNFFAPEAVSYLFGQEEFNVCSHQMINGVDCSNPCTWKE